MNYNVLSFELEKYLDDYEDKLQAREAMLNDIHVMTDILLKNDYIFVIKETIDHDITIEYEYSNTMCTTPSCFYTKNPRWLTDNEYTKFLKYQKENETEFYNKLP